MLALESLFTPLVTQVLRPHQVAKQLLADVALEHLSRCFGCLGRAMLLNLSLSQPLNRLAAPRLGQGYKARQPILLVKSLCCFDQIAVFQIYFPRFASVQSFLLESH